MTSINSVQNSAASNAVDSSRNSSKSVTPAKPAASGIDIDDVVDISEAGRKRLNQMAG